MLIGFGRHYDHTVAQVVLSDPRYIWWMLGCPSPSGDMRLASQEARRLIRDFDRLPFTERCSGRDCDAQATRVSVYAGGVLAQPWCDACNPYSLGAVDGRLTIVRTYQDAILHVQASCNGRKADQQKLIRELAMAKGLAGQITAEAAEEFFRDRRPASPS